MSDRLKAAFDKFDRENPHIYRLFRRYALRAIKRGKRQLSISLITERIRWEVSVETTGDRFKLNNNHRAFYARKFNAEFPQFGDVFAVRRQH
ncbi:hypothetical protein [Burkholderia cenocepacia]|uniref:hypothetical protein n=1 Tax=Burkholderia cenocepacia TaxID=95486 RepID=UPI0038CC010F